MGLFSNMRNEKNLNFDAMVIMDSDGEDNPEDIIKLVNKFSETSAQVVFAARERRSENLLFKFFYLLFRPLNWFLNGLANTFSRMLGLHLNPCGRTQRKRSLGTSEPADPRGQYGFRQRHIATDRGIFARGALKAALWGRGTPPGTYSMLDVLGLAGNQD